MDSYLDAKADVIDAGFGPEIDWQASITVEDIDESAFLREAAWVVLTTGFRESAVRSRFDAVSEAFLQWASAEEIRRNRQECVRAALRSFNHVGKISAIADIATVVATRGFTRFLDELHGEPLGLLQELPYVGPVTSRHLAKNLGLDVAKPDRHLVRIAAALRFPSAEVMCRSISDVVGDRIGVVDLVLWRFATLVSDYEQYFSRRRGSPARS